MSNSIPTVIYAVINHVENFYEEPEPEPEPEPTAKSNNTIPFIVGFGVAGLAVVLIGELYRIKIVRK